MSTRKVAAICRELFGDEVSHETVSHYAVRLDDEWEPWRKRRLEGRVPSVFLGGLVERGLEGVELIVSDAHAGLAHRTGVPLQRCQRHFLMNAVERVPRAREAEPQRALWRIWDDAESYDQARGALGELAASVETRDPHLAECLEVEGEEMLTCLHFPPGHRRGLRTTNGHERVNQELKRRSRVMRIFPNRETCLRLAAALVKEWHED